MLLQLGEHVDALGKLEVGPDIEPAIRRVGDTTSIPIEKHTDGVIEEGGTKQEGCDEDESTREQIQMLQAQVRHLQEDLCKAGAAVSRRGLDVCQPANRPSANDAAPASTTSGRASRSHVGTSEESAAREAATTAAAAAAIASAAAAGTGAIADTPFDRRAAQAPLPTCALPSLREAEPARAVAVARAGRQGSVSHSPSAPHVSDSLLEQLAPASLSPNCRATYQAAGTLPPTACHPPWESFPYAYSLNTTPASTSQGSQPLFTPRKGVSPTSSFLSDDACYYTPLETSTDVAFRTPASVPRCSSPNRDRHAQMASDHKLFRTSIDVPLHAHTEQDECLPSELALEATRLSPMASFSENDADESLRSPRSVQTLSADGGRDAWDQRSLFIPESCESIQHAKASLKAAGQRKPRSRQSALRDAALLQAAEGLVAHASATEHAPSPGSNARCTNETKARAAVLHQQGGPVEAISLDCDDPSRVDIKGSWKASENFFHSPKDFAVFLVDSREASVFNGSTIGSFSTSARSGISRCGTSPTRQSASPWVGATRRPSRGCESNGSGHRRAKVVQRAAQGPAHQHSPPRDVHSAPVQAPAPSEMDPSPRSRRSNTKPKPASACPSPLSRTSIGTRQPIDCASSSKASFPTQRATTRAGVLSPTSFSTSGRSQSAIRPFSM
eukprot:scaffold259642_cov33-Tisochrysis_lutea.AAC.4